jgi:hypothetical protein
MEVKARQRTVEQIETHKDLQDPENKEEEEEEEKKEKKKKKYRKNTLLN